MSDASPGEARDWLRAAGLRATRPRRVLLRVLAEAGTPLAAAEILRRARRYERTISLATVYRFLAVVRRTGIDGAPSQTLRLTTDQPASANSPVSRVVAQDVRFQLRATLGGVLQRFGYRLIRGSVDLEIEKLPSGGQLTGPI
jgi:Fur family ferric uptake transcriptional regulator